MIIGVIGGSTCPPDMCALAEEVGRQIASRGHTVLCGGMGGSMESACKGAKSADGTTIGLLPTGDIRDANDYVDFPIATEMGYARNVIIARTAGAIIAVGGEYGTLSEIAHALGFGVPVVGLQTWTLINGSGTKDEGILVASNPAQAVEIAITAATNRPEFASR